MFKAFIKNHRETVRIAALGHCKRSSSLITFAMITGSLLAGCNGMPEIKSEKAVAINNVTSAPIDPAIQKQYQQGLDLLEKKSYADAIPVFQAIIEKQPTLAGPFVNLGIAQAALEHTADAEKALLSALKIDSHHIVANNQLGLLYRRAGRFSDARLAYERALQTDPGYLLAHLNLGVLCDVYLRDIQCALQHLEKYQGLRSEEDKQVTAWLADIRQRISNPPNPAN